MKPMNTDTQQPALPMTKPVTSRTLSRLTPSELESLKKLAKQRGERMLKMLDADDEQQQHDTWSRLL
jgi:hypothetical protein